jgi:hypothetical protein
MERNIQPPMFAAITLPVLVDGKDIGICVYVAASPFPAPAVHELPISVMVAKVAAVVALRIKEQTIF